MNRPLVILSLIVLASCAKEEVKPSMDYSPPGWSRGIPTPLYPLDGATVTYSTSVPCRWSSVHDATEYLIDVRRIAGQDTIAIFAWTTTDTTRTVTTMNMPIGQPIIWRVTAQRPGAAAPTSGTPSPFFTFTRQ
jgi:hypothetical protein